MAAALSSTLKVTASWAFTDVLDLSTVIDSASLEYSKSMATGTAVDTADRLWHDQRTILTGANDDLDLTALTTSIFGSTVTINFAKVSALLIINTSTTAGDEIFLDSSVAAAWLAPFRSSATSKVEIGADSALFLSSKKDSWTVTATTADIIRITNPNAGSVTYKIAIFGRSA